MGYDPIVALFDKNHRETCWLWHEFALAVTHEIVEADCQYGCGIDHPQLLLHKLDLVAFLFVVDQRAVKIRFVEKEPRTSWVKAGPQEYGFYSNVNPERPHPRWSQASERRIGELSRRPTLMFNGYAEQVASLYEGMDLIENY